MGLSIEAECERAPVSLICQYIEAKKEELGAWSVCWTLTSADWTAGYFSDSACLCFMLPSSGPGNRFRPRSGCDTLGLSEDEYDCISARSTRQYR